MYGHTDEKVLVKKVLVNLDYMNIRESTNRE